MQINWIELRNKKTGMTLKKTVFPKTACLSGDSTEAIAFIFAAIKGAASFAQGQTDDNFLNVICRINFSANHKEYLWYAKNTADDQNTTIVDEEELYDQNNQMLMRRSFKEMTYEGYSELPNINLEKSMLYLFNTNDIPAEVIAAFSHIYYYAPTTETTNALLSELEQLPHGMAVLIDGTALTTPLDLTAIAMARKDLQLITSNCHIEHTAPLVVTLKGKMIGCK